MHGLERSQLKMNHVFVHFLCVEVNDEHSPAALCVVDNFQLIKILNTITKRSIDIKRLVSEVSAYEGQRK